jgi:hypothetical protein
MLLRLDMVAATNHMCRGPTTPLILEIEIFNVTIKIELFGTRAGTANVCGEKLGVMFFGSFVEPNTLSHSPRGGCIT